MARKPTSIGDLNAIMKRCSNIMTVRYVTTTIHPGFRTVVSIDIHTPQGTREFTTTNNPDPDFDLAKAVNEYLDELEAKQNG